MSACGFDADDVARAERGELEPERARAFDEHKGTCAACGEAAFALRQAKQVWQRSLDRDDAWRASARERRLSRGDAAAARVMPRWLLGAAVAMAGAMMWVALRTPGRSEPTAAGAPDAGPAVSATLAVVAPSARPAPEATASVAAVTSAPVPAAPAGSFVVRGACDGCTGHEALAAGGDVAVPRGTRLLLSWALAEGDVEVNGPAVVRTEGSTLRVAQGSATARSGTERELVTALARTRGAGTWRVEVRERRTRVEVVAGGLVLEASGQAHERRALRAGDRVDVLASGRIVAIDAPETGGLDDGWREAQAALARGDREAAERALRAALAEAPAGAMRDRADVTLGQLLLARRAVGEARPHLSRAMHSGTPAVASDAALLLARAQGSPAARAAVWAEYLGTSPPAPQRRMAELERANALLDAGDVASAREIATRLRGASGGASVVEAGLKRLEERLEAR